MLFIKKHGDTQCALVPGLDLGFTNIESNSMDWFMAMGSNGIRVNNRDLNIDSSNTHFMD